MKERGTLTESMFYVLMSFCGDRCAASRSRSLWSGKPTAGCGPATLYTLLGKFQEEA